MYTGAGHGAGYGTGYGAGYGAGYGVNNGMAGAGAMGMDLNLMMGMIGANPNFFYFSGTSQSLQSRIDSTSE